MKNVYRRIAKTAAVSLAAAALTMVLPATAAAQSTIFNIPTTDTVAPKKIYFEFDYLKQVPPSDEFSWQVIMPRVVFGVTDQVEAGLNFASTVYSDEGGTYNYVQPNVKYKFFADDDKGVAAAAGVIGYFAANKRDEGSDDFGMVYGEVSKKFKGSDHGPRVHGGVYGTLSYYEDNTAGVLVGYEQPITSTVSFVADWFSGENFWGYFTPGVSITLPNSSLLNIGYSIGNDPDDNKALFIYFGKTFR